MGVVGSNILAGSSGAAEAYTIDNSLRFYKGYLSKTFASAGDLDKWTVSVWLKNNGGVTSGSDGLNGILYSQQDNNDKTVIWNHGGGGPDFWNMLGGDSSAGYMNQNGVIRDCGSWYHFVFVWDSGQATDTDRMKFYKNGVRITSFNEYNPPLQNQDSYINKAAAHQIGYYLSEGGSQYNPDCYMAEYHFIDGTALDASSFGETDTATNQWKPIEYTGSYGTNGFYQKYSSTELAASFADSSDPTAFTPTEDITADVLIIAGGGGGNMNDAGGAGGGGGGAGGLKYFSQTSLTNATDYAVVVGDGGGGGGNGNDSSFGSHTALAGGRGAPLAGYASGTFGSGGGASDGSPGNVGQGTANQGNDGGAKGSGQGGGGGGSGAAGSTLTGGAGVTEGTTSVYDWEADDTSTVTLDINGTGNSYAGGGGGHPSGSGAAGGGNAQSGTSVGLPATANTGSGGGGSQYGYSGGAGGSGIVVIRYVGASPKATGGTITSYTDGSTYQVHTFLSSRVAHTITANGDVTNTRAESKVGDSSIYFDGTTDWLESPDSSDWQLGGGTGDFTWEAWIYPTDTTTEHRWWTQYEDHSNRWSFKMDSGKFTFDVVSGGSDITDIQETSASIAQDQWQHVAFVRDGSDAYFYVDGVSQTLTTTIALGTMPDISGVLYIGRFSSGSSQMYEGYMDEIRYSNTCRYPDGTTFTPSTTEFTADSNTKLLIHSNWDGGLGADSSGNKNDFTPTNLVATDQMVDSPTNNWCTMNPLDTILGNDNVSLSEGNLSVSIDIDDEVRGTIGIPTTGKWYWEYLKQDTITVMIGVADQASQVKAYGSDRSVVYNSYAGNVYNFAPTASYGVSYTDGDVVGIAINMDDGEITFYKNNASQGTLTMGGTAAQRSRLIPTNVTGSGQADGTFNFGQDSSFAGAETAQGNQDSNGIGDFYYEPPTDYLALCSSNLASPEIALPTDHFNTLLWDGDDGSSRTVSGVGFQPDLFWLKSRGIASSQRLQDSVRGDNGTRMYVLNSNSTAIESTDTSILSLTSDGFTTDDNAGAGGGNNSGENYVGWFWKAGGTAASNTDGSITSSVSANTTAGFSIVSYTSPGTDSDETVGHGLSQRPDMVIIKNLDSTYNWDVWTPALQSGYDLRLNTTDDETSGRWSTTIPTASLVTLLDTYEVAGTDDYIAYCFHSVEGYSKVGSYEGNGVVDGTFIYTGMKPSYLLIKTTNLTGHSWYIWDDKRDTINPNDKVLYPNNNTDEQTSTDYSIDFLSNGFKIRNASNLDNNSSGTYLYLAFAESPFKYSNAR